MSGGTPMLAAEQPRPTIVIPEVTTWPEYPGLWRQLLDEIYAFVRSDAGFGPERPPGGWQNVMLYLDDRPSVEVGVLAPGPFTPQGRIIASHLPGGPVATAVHHGEYEHLGRTHDAVREFAERQGRELAGPLWEVYGHWREDPAELETEIYYLLR
jgi:effector-binding domain-containing protein